MRRYALRTTYSRTRWFFVITALVLSTSCGGGSGGGTPITSEGSPSSPLNLGVVNTTALVHPGSISGSGDSYYQFTTGPVAGVYTIGLTNTRSDVGWALFFDTLQHANDVCDDTWYAASNEVCTTTPLSASTTYWIMVREFEGVSGTYTLTIKPPVSSGTTVHSYSYNFDDGTLQGWAVTGTWGVTGSASHSGGNSVTDSPAGSYAFNTDTSLTSPVLDLTGTTKPALTFYHKYELEFGRDFGYVEISTDGGTTFSDITPNSANGGGHSFTSTISTFALQSIDLTPYKSFSNVKIRFRMTTDYVANYDGWYIDDISIVD